MKNSEEQVIYKLIEQWVLMGYSTIQLHVYYIISFLSVLTQLPVWIVFVFTWWTFNPSPEITAIKIFCLLVCFTVVSIGRTQYFKWKKVFAVQNTTYYSRKCNIMVRAWKMSMKEEQPKELEEPLCSYFTVFAVFTNSTPASLVLTVKQNNATMMQSTRGVL